MHQKDYRWNWKVILYWFLSSKQIYSHSKIKRSDQPKSTASQKQIVPNHIGPKVSAVNGHKAKPKASGPKAQRSKKPQAV